MPADSSHADAPRDAGGPTLVPAIPDFELVRQIGRGSYGDVWLARSATGILRAIKVVWRKRFADAEPFEREWRGLKEFAAISIGESAQLALLHVGRNDAAGVFYYVMELADDAERGRDIDPASYVPLTLAELRARRKRLPAEQCIAFGVQLAAVLAALHRRGLLHRDIKPANVILVGGVPKLADIGLVTTTHDASTFIGTAGYVPPEGPGSPSADVFALGKVLYELVTGLDRQEFPQLPPDLKRLPDQKALLELNEIILRACEPHPEHRYRDGAELLVDLERLSAGRPVRRFPAWKLAAAVVLVVVVGMGAWKWSRPTSASPASTVTAAPPASAPPAAAASEKSLVILPFENLSPDPANAFFTDGMHAEIIATLSRLADLTVLSRSTAQTFKGTLLSLQEIGRKLNVTNVLTGSVHREASSVRVQLELRRASDEAVLWQKTFERELQPGFALQNEISDEIARMLRARASTGWYAGARFMTKNPEAYLLFLQARELMFTKGPTVDALEEQIRLSEKALQLDPEFMSAASLLSTAYAYYWSTVVDPVKRKQIAANAKRWAERASELVPGGAGDGALAVYYSMVENDRDRALPYALNEVRALPNDANGHNRLGAQLSARGRPGEALAEYDRALALDPLNVRVLFNRVLNIGRLRRPADFEAAVARSLEFGGRNVDRGAYATFRFLLTGVLPKPDDNVAGYLPARLLLLWYGRKFEETVEKCTELLGRAEGVTPPIRMYAVRRLGSALHWLGREEALARLADETRAFEQSLDRTEGPDPSRFDEWRLWGLTFAGKKDEAIAVGRRYVEGAAGAGQVAERWEREHQLAQVYAWFGQTKECVALLEKLLRVPSLVTVPYLRLAPDWDRVRDDASFRALVDNPRNSAPL